MLFFTISLKTDYCQKYQTEKKKIYIPQLVPQNTQLHLSYIIKIKDNTMKICKYASPCDSSILVVALSDALVLEYFYLDLFKALKENLSSSLVPLLSSSKFESILNLRVTLGFVHVWSSYCVALSFGRSHLHFRQTMFLR